MKNLLFVLFILFAVNIQGQQVSIADLPDLLTTDSIRVQKRLFPGDTVRKVRFISFRKLQGNTVGDTVSGRWLDSAQTASLLHARLLEETSQAAGITYSVYQAMQKDRGLTQYARAFRRVSTIEYGDFNWEGVKAGLVGTWGLSGQGITAQSFNLSDLAVARRALPVPQGETRHSGKVDVLAGNRVRLSNYFVTGQSMIFDMIVAPNQANGNLTVFMSPDGRFYLTRIAGQQ